MLPTAVQLAEAQAALTFAAKEDSKWCHGPLSDEQSEMEDTMRGCPQTSSSMLPCLRFGITNFAREMYTVP